RSTIAMIGLRPNVAGRSMLIPASGPTPGSTPTSVPITQPTKAYTSIEGWSATEKPSSRLLNVSAICEQWPESSALRLPPSDPPGPQRQRHSQPGREHEIGDERESQRDGDHHDRPLALDRAEEENEERRHRQAVAETLERQRGKSACRQYHDGAHELGPAG